MTLDELHELLADETADPEQVLRLVPDHWTSLSYSAWFMGYGMQSLKHYGRRGLNASALLPWFGFLLDNPQPRDSIRVSMPLLRHWSSRTERTTRLYLDILHDADIVLTGSPQGRLFDAGPDNTYRRGLWFPYPTTTSMEQSMKELREQLDDDLDDDEPWRMDP